MPACFVIEAVAAIVGLQDGHSAGPVALPGPVKHHGDLPRHGMMQAPLGPVETINETLIDKELEPGSDVECAVWEVV